MNIEFLFLFTAILLLSNFALAIFYPKGVDHGAAQYDD